VTRPGSGHRAVRIEARLLLGAVALATVAQAAVAGWQSVQLARASRRALGLSHAEATRRELGAAYYQSVVEARRAFPIDGAVWFVDQQSAPAGATYFALYYLAPRRLYRLGSTRENSEWWLSRQVPPGVERILLVGDPGKPLEIVSVAEYGERPRDR